MALRVCVVGAGATGGYFGAMAARGGADVTFVQRGAHGAAMRERGVTVRQPSGEVNARPRVVASVDEVKGERFEVVLCTVKMGDLAGVAAACAALCADGGAVITAQNGVDAEEIAAAWVPAEKLVGGVSLIGANVPEPGVVFVHGFARLMLGAASAAADAAARRAVSELEQVGVPVSFAPDLAATRWVKLVWNNAWNVVTCLTGLPVASAGKIAEVRALATAAMRETEAVGRASGVKLPSNVVEMCLQQGDAVGDVQTSMLQDRLAGRPLEVEALCGVIVKRGKALGVATPVNEMLYALLLGATAASVAPARRG